MISFNSRSTKEKKEKFGYMYQRKLSKIVTYHVLKCVRDAIQIRFHSIKERLSLLCFLLESGRGVEVPDMLLKFLWKNKSLISFRVRGDFLTGQDVQPSS